MGDKSAAIKTVNLRIAGYYPNLRNSVYILLIVTLRISFRLSVLPRYRMERCVSRLRCPRIRIGHHRNQSCGKDTGSVGETGSEELATPLHLVKQ
jgi:hypothetical protein